MVAEFVFLLLMIGIGFIIVTVLWLIGQMNLGRWDRQGKKELLRSGHVDPSLFSQGYFDDVKESREYQEYIELQRIRERKRELEEKKPGGGA